MLHLSCFFWSVATSIPTDGLRPFSWCDGVILIVQILNSAVVTLTFTDITSSCWAPWGTGDLICRLVIGPLITVWKLDVTKLYAISQIACAITTSSFPTVVNGVQMIIQGFLFSVTFGCQCLFLGNLLQWSNESACDFVPLNLMVLFLALVPRALFGSENLNRIFGVSIFSDGLAFLLVHRS
jgi:hypothetical protein